MFYTGNSFTIFTQSETKWGRGVWDHLNQPMVSPACVVSALKGEENLRAPEREEGPSLSCIPVYSPFPFCPQE